MLPIELDPENPDITKKTLFFSYFFNNLTNIKKDIEYTFEIIEFKGKVEFMPTNVRPYETISVDEKTYMPHAFPALKNEFYIIQPIEKSIIHYKIWQLGKEITD